MDVLRLRHRCNGTLVEATHVGGDELEMRQIADWLGGVPTTEGVVTSDDTFWRGRWAVRHPSGRTWPLTHQELHDRYELDAQAWASPQHGGTGAALVTPSSVPQQASR